MLNLRTNLYTSSYRNYFVIELTIQLRLVKLELGIGNRVKGFFYLDVRPYHLEFVDDIPLNFHNQMIAIACGGRGYDGYMGEIFWFPSQRQKEHFLFLLGRLPRSEEKKTYTIEPSEISLDDIPF